MANTDSQLNTVAWNEVNWRQVQTTVFKLQRRIYQASLSGNVRQMRKLQKTLLKSYYAKLLAVRKVTQENQGKKTAGVDGIKSLNPVQRLKLARELKLNDKGSPTRRVWIPKPGKDEKRPLGIPTLRDRALQTLATMALEPEWEAVFEPNSYGFRPGRSAHDAITAIYIAICKKPKFVLDADLAKCFDRINHEKLLEKVNTFPTLQRQIRAWLKAGVIDEGEFFSTDEGTPQGGTISPLLANIALHGMEEAIAVVARSWKGTKTKNLESTTLVRYADDLVIFHPELPKLMECQQALKEFLNPLGLELKPSKTKIVHTLNELDRQSPGFDFLGFNVRQYKVGKHKSGKKNDKGLGFKTLIKPSKDACSRHHKEIAKVTRRRKAARQRQVIHQLNPIIRGWSNYYRSVVASSEFSRQDHLTFLSLWAWAKRRHSNKNSEWIKGKYFHTVGNRNWVFQDGEYTLLQHSDTRINRHTKVKGTKSPYDGDWVYWTRRRGRHPNTPTRVANLMKRQKGKCNLCGLYFHVDDLIEVDHVIPRSCGGKDTYGNLQLLHRHCHDTKTANDGSLTSARDKRRLRKEPDEVKVSSPVL